MNDRRSCGRSETGSVICGNGNLTELYLGNNELLRTLDVRNCPNLTQAVDISGCVNIEHVYFDGTAITGLELPKGGIIKTLHLPETLTSLSVLDHAGITDFVLPSVDNLSTCRLENVGEGIDTKAMINALPARCRVRLIGFDWTVENEAELTSLKAVFDTMRGQNEAGGNEDIAQLYGRIHIVTITGAVLKEFRETYPDVSVFYSNITSKCYYWNYDCFTGILFCKACGSVMHRQPRGKNSVTWVCHKHAMHPDLCRMKPQSDDDLERAFINCLNKIAWSQARGEGVLDVYETMLGKTEAEKNAERLVEIEKELEENRNETNKLNAIVMRERFLPEHREKKLFLTKQAQDLMAEKNRILIAGAPSGTLQQLKTFIGGWKITDDPAAFPEETFTEFVERCIVLPGKMVTFDFRCGLKLTESLYQSILEDGR